MPWRKRWYWDRPSRYYHRTRSYVGDRRMTTLLVIILAIVLLAIWNQSTPKNKRPKMPSVSVEVK